MAERIGLLTLPLRTNYGGILQAVALYHFLTTEMKKDVVLLEPEWTPTMGSPRWIADNILQHLPGLPLLQSMLAKTERARPRRPGLAGKVTHSLLGKVNTLIRTRRSAHHRPFIQKFIPRRSGRQTGSQDLGGKVRALGLEALVVGSDQVWRLEYLPGRSGKSDFFLGFETGQDVRRISYAASFGLDSWTYPEVTGPTKALLAQFDAVSVREASGVAICADIFDRHDAVHVIDPTLLLDPAFYLAAAAPAPEPQPGKILLNYLLDDDETHARVIDQVLGGLGPDHSVQSLKLDRGRKTLDVPGWLRAFIDADFVVTDSFHGMIFSIIFRKNFIAIANLKRGAERFVSLLQQVGLEERLIVDPASGDQLERLARTPVDFDAVTVKLTELRARSADFLRQALA